MAWGQKYRGKRSLTSGAVGGRAFHFDACARPDSCLSAVQVEAETGASGQQLPHFWSEAVGLTGLEGPSLPKTLRTRETLYSLPSSWQGKTWGVLPNGPSPPWILWLGCRCQISSPEHPGCCISSSRLSRSESWSLGPWAVLCGIWASQAQKHGRQADQGPPNSGGWKSKEERVILW